jgi:undecaprenyl-diphosphatase
MAFQNLRHFSEQLIRVWRQRIATKVSPLVTTIPIVGLMIAGLAVWAFLEIADEVLEKETQVLDTRILLAIKPLHSPLFDYVMHGFSIVGGTVVVTLVCLGLGATFWIQRRKPEFNTLAIAAIGAVCLNLLIKFVFKRDRPKLWELVDGKTHTSSFPSGHAMLPLVIYGLVGYLLASRFHRWRWWIICGTVLLLIGIGFSRLYLGLHWPTDVVAGYTAGIPWLVASILNLEVRRKNRAERQRLRESP